MNAKKPAETAREQKKVKGGHQVPNISGSNCPVLGHLTSSNVAHNVVLCNLVLMAPSTNFIWHAATYLLQSMCAFPFMA